MLAGISRIDDDINQLAQLVIIVLDRLEMPNDEFKWSKSAPYAFDYQFKSKHFQIGFRTRDGQQVPYGSNNEWNIKIQKHFLICIN